MSIIKWKYFMFFTSEVSGGICKEWGEKGWELVSVTVEDGIYGFYFKQPMP